MGLQGQRRGLAAPTTTGAYGPRFPIVEAKLHPPARRTETVTRERLLELLSEAADAPVVLLVAPPGYGKTALLTDWAARQDRPVAWLTLDAFDNDPSVFLAYLAVAIDRIHPVDAGLGDAIIAPGSRILGAVVPRLAAELHRIGGPALLVLDDVHRLRDRTCLDALSALIDHLPPGFQLALAARAVPDLQVARFRANRQLVEIGQDDLALDASETQRLTAAAGHRLSPEQAEDLVRRTEGWAAAIYLATLATRRGDAAGMAPAISGRDRYIAEYLRSELLDGLSEADRMLLTQTSILEIVEAPIAEAITGQSDAADRLRFLASGNRLILQPGGSGEVYRYHNLLRDFLRGELDQREPGGALDAHRRAAAWFAQTGHPELAIEHALISDRGVAARLVVASTQLFLFGGHADRLDRWITTFDEADFRRRPDLAVMGAWNHLLNGRGRTADLLADIADDAADESATTDGSASFASARSILRAVMARHGPAALLADATLAVEVEPPGSPWRSIALMLLGTAHIVQGDSAAAERALLAATDEGAIGGATVAWALRTSLALAQGDWKSGEAYAREMRAALARAHLGNLLPALPVYAASARIAIHGGRIEAAREDLVRAQLVRPLACEAAPVVSVIGLLDLSRAHLALSDVAGARSVLGDAETIIRRRPGLGVLETQALELRDRLSHASSTLAGSSTLTAAELRLLPILSTPLTFKEIGERVYLSHHTIKTHAISIYGKLQASSRSEAVERAIELGLLEPFPTLAPRNAPRS